MKIAFWDNSLNIRGTSVAIYDYAYYNRKLLGNESIIVYNRTRQDNDAKAIEKFRKEFKVFGINQFHDIDPILKEEGCDILYVIEAGDVMDRVSKVCKTVNHCVFICHAPHGNAYAAISKWVTRKNPNVPVVPHMIALPDNTDDMRDQLCIPRDATVIGRHGANDSFDIAYVKRIVHEVAKSNPSIYFLFMNTDRFCESLPNIIHIDSTANLEDKVKFINSCDAMLWARGHGETFGCAIGEFSVRNKPIFATKVGDLAHYEILGENAYWYTESNLKQMLLTFNRDEASKKDWNMYRDYEPEKVMKLFKEIFIDPVTQ